MPIDTFMLSTSDPDEADRTFEQLYRPERRLDGHRSTPTFSLSIEGLDSADLHSARIRHTLFSASDLPPIAEVVVSTVLSGRLWCGHGGAMPVAAAAGDVVLYPDAYRIQLGWDDVDVIILRIPTQAVERAAAEEFGERPNAFAFVDMEPVSAAARQSWASLAQLVHTQLAAPGSLLGEPLPRERLIQLLARTALSTFPNTYSEDHRRHDGGAVGTRSLRHAAAFIDECFEEPLTLSDVAWAVAADPAALRGAFRAVYGVTPMQYLTRVRLEVAHRELAMGGASDDDSVPEVAARASFLSARQFIAAYVRRFGIAPGETLRRAREGW